MTTGGTAKFIVTVFIPKASGSIPTTASNHLGYNKGIWHAVEENGFLEQRMPAHMANNLIYTINTLNKQKLG